MQKLLDTLPHPDLDAVVVASPTLSYAEVMDELTTASTEGQTDPGQFYDAVILQLGSFTRYKLFRQRDAEELHPGEIVKCHLYKCSKLKPHYVLLPLSLCDGRALPTSLAKCTGI
jgi:hypothetical protein